MQYVRRERFVLQSRRFDPRACDVDGLTKRHSCGSVSVIGTVAKKPVHSSICPASKVVLLLSVPEMPGNVTP